MANNEEFADKVLSALKKSQLAVDLTETQVAQQSDPVFEITPFAGNQTLEDAGPTTGGFKDILIIPSYGGVAATTPSQINFYWKSPTTPDLTGTDLNVRTTIYNFAQTTGAGVTTPVLVFGGYDGTNHYLPARSWNAQGIGSTAKIFLDPFRGDITLDYLELNAGTASSTRQGNMWYDSAGDKLRFAISTSTASGFAKTLAFTDDIPGSVNMFFNWSDSFSNTSTPDAAQDTFTLSSGLGVTVFINSGTDTATFGAAVRSLNDTITSQQFLIASPAVVASGTALSFLSDVSYVPSTRLFSIASGFVSASIFTGTAVTATWHVGSLIGTATTAQNVNVVTTTSGSYKFPMISATSGSGLALSSDNDLTFDAANNTLTTGIFLGNLSGNAVTATTFTGSFTGTATTAQNVNVVTTTSGSYRFPLISATSGSGLALSSDNDLSYDAATNTLTTGIFTGNVTGTAVTGNFVTANTLFNGNLSGNAVTAVWHVGSLVGTATTAQNVNVVTTTSGSYRFPLISATSGSGLALSSDNDLTFDAATNTLTTGIFTGNVTGTAVTGNFVTANTLFNGNLSGNAVTAVWHVGSLVGTATTAQNVNVVTTTSGSYKFPMISATSGSGLALSSDNDLTFDAANNTLTTGIFLGNVSGSAITATFFTGGTFTGAISGTATTAQNVNVVTTTSGSYKFPMISATSGSGLALSSDNDLTFDAAANTLTTGIFLGNVSGSAVTATWHTGTLTGTATTATNVVSVATGTTNTQHFLMLSPTSSGSGVALSSAGTALSFQPSTNTLFTTSVQANGVIVGSASNTINVTSGSLTLGSGSNNVVIPGNLSVQGTTITVDSTISTLVDPIFVIGSAAGGTSLFTDDAKDRGVEFRWSTGAGNASTGFFGFDRSTTRFTFIPSGTNVGEVFSGGYGVFEGNLTGNAVTASHFTGGTFSGTFNGTFSGFASTANAVTVGAVVAGTYYPTFVNTNAGSSIGLTLVTDANISFDANTNALTVPMFLGNITGTAVTGGFVTATGLFNGNLSGNAVTATFFTGGTFSGSLVGTATTAQNVNVVTTTSGSYRFPLISATSGSGLALSSDNDLTYDAATNTLTTGIFTGNVTGTAVTGNFVTANTLFNGNLSGNAVTAVWHVGSLVGTATTAQNVNVVTTTSGSYRFPLISATSGSGLALSSDNDLTYDAATNTLTTGIFTGNVTGTAVTGGFVTATGLFNGNLSGNAVTATFFTGGTFSGTFTGSATTAQNVNVVTTTSGSYRFPLISATSGSGLALSSDNDLTYDAATNTLTTGIFTGNVTGTAVTGNFVTANTLFNGNLSGNAVTAVWHVGSLVGTATTAQNVNVVTTTSGSYRFPLISATSGSGLALSSDNDLTYDAATNTLTTGIFTGNVTGTAVTGNFVTASTLFNGNLSGNAVTAVWHVGSLVGTATTAQNVNVVTTTSGTYKFPMISATSGSGLALSSDNDLTFDAAVNTLTTGVFLGNLSGTAVTATTLTGALSGSATTAQNVNVVDNGTLNTTQYMLFGAARTGSGVAVSSNLNVFYNPSTNLLTTGGLAVTSSTALSSGTYLTIRTHPTDDNSTTDFFLRGVNSDGTTSKFSVDANGNLRATTKSFDIAHPTVLGKRLVYGVLEGPEHGVYHRGTVEGKGAIQVMLPEYWHKLVGEDYTIQLTPWGNYNVHIVDKNQDYFVIRLVGDPISRILKNIKVDYIVHGSRLDAPLNIIQD